MSEEILEVADDMHAMLVELATAMANAIEGSLEDEEFRRISDLIQTYENLRAAA